MELRDHWLGALATSSDFFIVFAATGFAKWNNPGDFPKDRWGGNVKYFYEAIKSGKFGGLEASVCVWYEKEYGNSHYVLAASRSVRITCVANAGCTQEHIFYCPDDPSAKR